MSIEEFKKQAKDATTAPEILTELAKHKDNIIRQYVAENPNTTIATLESLGAEFPDSIVANPIFNLLLLEDPYNKFIGLSLARVSTTLTEVLTKLAQRPDNEIGLAIIRHKNVSTQTLEQLAITQYNKKQPADFYYSIIQHPHVSPKVLDLIIINCNYYSVRQLILKHPLTSTTTLERFIFFNNFFSYRNFTVKLPNYNLLVNHPNISWDIIKLLDFIDLNSYKDISWEKRSFYQRVLEELVQYVSKSINRSIFQNRDRELTVFDDIKDKVPQDLIDNPLLNLLLIHNPESGYFHLALASNPRTPREIFDILSETRNRYILWALARNSNTPTYIIEKLAKSKNIVIHNLIAEHPNISEAAIQSSRKFLSDLAQKSTDLYKLRGVAQNPHAPQETIDFLIKNNSFEIRSALAKNTRISEETALFLTRDSSRKVRKYLAMNPNISQNIIEILVRDRSYCVIVGIAKNHRTPVEILVKLATSENYKIRCGIAENPQTPLYILRRLQKDRERNVRAKLARNPNISPDIMESLAGNAIAFVRQELVRNPQVPATILDKLTSDRNEKVLQYLVRHPNISLATLKKLTNHRKQTIAKAATQASRILEAKTIES